jgi:hypothetical protein
MEARMRELAESGEFSGLPGEGQPLPPDPDADAGELWAARHVVRTSGARPQWAELRREIAEKRSRIVTRLRAHRHWLERRAALLARVPAERIASEASLTKEVDARVRAEIAGSIAELNALVRDHNLRLPTPSLHLATASLESLVEIAEAREGA